MNLLVRIILILSLICSPALAGITFDKVDDLLTCGATDDIMEENVALTISAWIKPVSTGLNGGGRIIERLATDGNPGVVFHMINTDTLRFLVAGTTNLVRTASNSSVTLNAWNHVLVTWDGSTTAANVSIYVNGTVTTYQTTTNGVTIADNSTETVKIGDTSIANRTFDGIITEIAVWQVVLTAQEIATLALSRVKGMPLQIQPASLDAYWPLHEEEDGSSADADTFINYGTTSHTCTGDNGANNLGLSATAESVLTYP